MVGESIDNHIAHTSRFIAVDWGSSQLRAYLIDRNEGMLAHKGNNHGIFSPDLKDFEDSLMSVCADWVSNDIPIIMSGMIGSKQGWQETAYIPCPVGVSDLGKRLVHVKNDSMPHLYIVPGVSWHGPDRFSDVMRGEEPQIFGAIKNMRVDNIMMCLPGTHSKWVRIECGNIIRFTTFFTGELYHMLSLQGSIAALSDMEGPFEQAAFLEGIEFGAQQGGGLLHHIFALRANALTRQGNINKARLSGLLIGHEIRAALRLYHGVGHILLIGDQQLSLYYQLALSTVGIESQVVPTALTYIEGIQEIFFTRPV